MRLTLAAALMGGFLLANAPASAAFDPRDHRAPLAGEPSIVMVLGTPHLSGLPENFRPESVSHLVDRLACWKPDAIAIEGVSGLQCDQFRRNPAFWADATESYCVDVAPAARASGLDVPTATAEAARLLSTWPADPSPGNRRHLALTFLAAGEPASAVVQWLRLPPADRIAADGLTPELATWLDARILRRNESYLVAAALAARLGHERVWSTDDHSADILTSAPDPAFEQAMKEIWSGPALDRRIAGFKAAEADLTSGPKTLALYRLYNQPDYAESAFETDFGAAMRHDSPQQYGRRYLGWWETRNLRMAANVREVAALKPGSRVLVLTGASHKGYLDAYLGMMHDVKVESPLPLLQP